MPSTSDKIDGTYVRVMGQGPPVVFIHGVGLDHAMWEPQLATLSEHFTVIRYDMLGHGKSDNTSGHVTLRHFVAQLDRLLTHLSLASIRLVGFSMGGAVSLTFAAAHPSKVNRLVLMNTVYRRTADQTGALMKRVNQVAAGGPSVTADAALERWFSPEFRQHNPGVMAAIRHRLASNNPEGYLTAYRLFANADDAIDNAPGSIQCPTLVMTGELDIGSTPLMSQQLAESIADAELAILPGQRHMASTEAADDVNHMLLHFLHSESGRPNHNPILGPLLVAQ